MRNLVFALALIGCGQSREQNLCGDNALASTNRGAAVYCAYGVVIGGIRPCPADLQDLGQFAGIDGNPRRVCGDANAAFEPSLCAELGLACANRDAAIAADARIAAGTTRCPTAWPTIRDSCTNIGEYCAYDCNGERQFATCEDGIWRGVDAGSNCSLDYAGPLYRCPEQFDQRAQCVLLTTCNYSCSQPAPTSEPASIESAFCAPSSNAWQWADGRQTEARNCVLTRADTLPRAGCPTYVANATPVAGELLRGSCEAHAEGLTCSGPTALFYHCDNGTWVYR